MVHGNVTLAIGNVVEISFAIVEAAGPYEALAMGIASSLVLAVGVIGALFLLRKIYQLYQDGEFNLGDTITMPAP